MKISDREKSLCDLTQNRTLLSSEFASDSQKEVQGEALSTEQALRVSLTQL